MDNITISYVQFIFSVMIASFSQLLLKMSANKKYHSTWKEYANIYVISAYSLFIISLILTSRAYKDVPLTYGIIMENLGIVFVLILGKIFLKEKFSKKMLIGVTLILLGILIATR